MLEVINVNIQINDTLFKRDLSIFGWPCEQTNRLLGEQFAFRCKNFAQKLAWYLQ